MDVHCLCRKSLYFGLIGLVTLFVYSLEECVISGDDGGSCV